jgi:vacuolar-type H+-ATPase subunit F/Vma7
LTTFDPPLPTGFLIAGVSDFYILEKSSAEHIAKVSSRLKKMARNLN